MCDNDYGDGSKQPPLFPPPPPPPPPSFPCVSLPPCLNDPTFLVPGIIKCGATTFINCKAEDERFGCDLTCLSCPSHSTSCISLRKSNQTSSRCMLRTSFSLTEWMDKRPAKSTVRVQRVRIRASHASRAFDSRAALANGW